jgi:hypothetical protein
VAEIHNSTTESPELSLLTPAEFFQTRVLADTHEFNLAYNASSPIRAIAGATLAAQIVQGLNSTITSNGSTKLIVQFGAYGSFQSFFGLANLTAASPDFYGIPDYASTMTFELFTNTTPAPGTFPGEDDLSVRFLFHNGTTSNISQPTAFPLFGQSATVLSWADFTAGMNQFAIGTQAAWCNACGNTTGVCASSAPSAPGSGSGSSPSAQPTINSSSGNGLSPAVNGVIGAMVTLAVILGLEALILLVCGLRVVSKKRVAGLNSGVQAKA